MLSSRKVKDIEAQMTGPRWLRWEPPGMRRFGYSGRAIVASVIRDSNGAVWHWRVLEGLKPPRRERWTLQGMAATEEEATAEAERAWRQLCEVYGLAPAGEQPADNATEG